MYIGSITDQHISIAALQRRTGNDAVPARTTHLINPGRDRAKPGPAILVGQRNTLMHLVDIGWGVKPIGILELPMQTLGKQCSHRRLTAPRNAHEDDYGCKGRRPLLTHGRSSLQRTFRGRGGALDEPMKTPYRASSPAGIVTSPVRARATIVRFVLLLSKRRNRSLSALAGKQ